jgi:hypothetical protein
MRVYKTKIEGLMRAQAINVLLPNLCKSSSMIPVGIIFSGVNCLSVKLMVDAVVCGVYSSVFFDHSDRIDLDGFADLLCGGGQVMINVSHTGSVETGLPTLEIEAIYEETTGVPIVQKSDGWGDDLRNFFKNQRDNGFLTNVMFQSNIPLGSFKLVPTFKLVEGEEGEGEEEGGGGEVEAEGRFEELIIPFENRERADGKAGSLLRLDLTSGVLREIRSMLSYYHIECTPAEGYEGRDLVVSILGLGFRK